MSYQGYKHNEHHVSNIQSCPASNIQSCPVSNINSCPASNIQKCPASNGASVPPVMQSHTPVTAVHRTVKQSTDTFGLQEIHFRCLMGTESGRRWSRETRRDYKDPQRCSISHKQTDRHTDRQTDTQTHKHTETSPTIAKKQIA